MATFTVSNTNDSGTGSLRQAIADANASAGIPDTIVFSLSAGSTITLTSAQLTISDDLFIDGDINNDGVADITVQRSSTTSNFRIFNINDGSSTQIQVTIEGLVITGGSVVGNGGGIFNRENLTINNSTLSGNSAVDGGDGGGIRNFGTTTINNSTLSGNTAGDDGGGIFNTGTTTINNSTLSGNTGDNFGGGIFNDDNGTIEINNSTFSNNTAGTSGGGIRNDGTIEINNSTLSNNTASIFGGGIRNLATATITINNSTLSGNTAGDDGGGIFNTGTTTLFSTIVADNTAPNNADLLRISGTINATFSLIENNSSEINGIDINNITGQDPLLGPLQNNGGPTFTRALLAGSPAIDAGSTVSLTTDQRGGLFVRTFGAQTDIGAFEVQPDPLTNNSSQITRADFVSGSATIVNFTGAVVSIGAEIGEPIAADGVTVSPDINTGNVFGFSSSFNSLGVNANTNPVVPALPFSIGQIVAGGLQGIFPDVLTDPGALAAYTAIVSASLR